MCVSGIRRAALHFVYKMQATTTTIVLLLSLQINRLIFANCGHDKAAKAKQQTVRLTEWLTDRLIDRLADRLTEWLADCVTAWQIEWLPDWQCDQLRNQSSTRIATMRQIASNSARHTSYASPYKKQQQIEEWICIHTHMHTHTYCTLCRLGIAWI